ncbi:MAG: CBS domain-containing protein, partial [Bdellovibrionales bacterium]|nr:CBS domain-containing protein [Bdellovibrionales bacterium]
DVSLSLSLTKHITDESSIRLSYFCFSDPYIIDAEERLDVVLNYMATHRIGSCLVTKNDELVGIITTTDICRVCGDFLKDFFDQLKDS